jgi:hypothetical protein
MDTRASMRGGYRRQFIIPGHDASVWAGGRWGPRRLRTDECYLTLRAELVYDDAIRNGLNPKPGDRLSLAAGRSGGPQARVSVEVRGNRLWRLGRFFFRCSKCNRLATRLYVPRVDWIGSPWCRRCWGLNHRSQSNCYKPTGFLGGILGSFYQASTYEHRIERRRAARERYHPRRELLSAIARQETGG